MYEHVDLRSYRQRVGRGGGQQAYILAHWLTQVLKYFILLLLSSKIMLSISYNHTSKDFNFSSENHFESTFVQLGHLE
jgi:hypothetical protein